MTDPTPHPRATHALAGLLLAAHGSQKLFGWFGGYGIAGTGGWLDATCGGGPANGDGGSIDIGMLLGNGATGGQRGTWRARLRWCQVCRPRRGVAPHAGGPRNRLPADDRAQFGNGVGVLTFPAADIENVGTRSELRSECVPGKMLLIHLLRESRLAICRSRHDPFACKAQTQCTLL